MTNNKITIVTNETIFSYSDGTEIQIAAVIKEVTIHKTKMREGKMAMAEIESHRGPIYAIFFPGIYCRTQSLLKKGAL